MNLIEQVEFEIAYYKVAVQSVYYFEMGAEMMMKRMESDDDNDYYKRKKDDDDL